MVTTSLSNLSLVKLFRGIGYLSGARCEDALSNEVAIMLRNLSLDGKLVGVWFHIPNESVSRSKLDIFRLIKKQKMGMISGIPDFAFMSNDKSLFIELKYGDNSLSESQRLVKEWSECMCIPHEVCRTSDEVMDVLCKYNWVIE